MINVSINLFIIAILLTQVTNCDHESVTEEFCSKNNAGTCQTEESSVNSRLDRYLLYDVNPPEGFNLRRDVYIRLAVFAHRLKNAKNEKLNKFKLVLPPWTNLYHWNRDEDGKYFSWSQFFDLESLQRFAPVIEMHQFFVEIGEKYKKTRIDEVYVLAHFEDMFETGNFEDRYAVTSCKDNINVRFYGYENLTSNNIKCLSFHGYTSQLTKILEKTKARSVMFDHAEIPLHDEYGSSFYWQARRSMRFNKDLYEIANDFREKKLHSTNTADNINRPEDWTLERPNRNARGGPYISVHMRRRDFLWGRPDQVPSIQNTAKQIKTVLQEQKLTNVFIATDAPNDELQELKDLLSKDGYKVFHLDNSELKLNSGELAIVDQIICAHARYFLGTHESTFSFRIQEEREILGFPPDTTFNRLCGDKAKCDKPSVWKIVY